MKTHAACLVIGSIIGFIIAFQANPEPTVRIVEKSVIKYQTVYRDYETITRETCVDKLKCYDTAGPRLDGTIEGTTFRAKAGLCDRTWEREFKLEVGSSGNWRYYIGAGLVGMAAGGFALWYFTK